MISPILIKYKNRCIMFYHINHLFIYVSRSGENMYELPHTKWHKLMVLNVSVIVCKLHILYIHTILALLLDEFVKRQQWQLITKWLCSCYLVRQFRDFWIIASQAGLGSITMINYNYNYNYTIEFGFNYNYNYFFFFQNFNYNYNYAIPINVNYNYNYNYNCQLQL